MNRIKRFFNQVVLMILVAVCFIAAPSYTGKCPNSNKKLVAKVQASKAEKKLEHITCYSDILNMKWIKTVVRCKQYLFENNYSYDMSYLKQIPLDKNKIKHVDCSSFVSWALYEYGYKDFAGKQWTSKDFARLLKPENAFVYQRIMKFDNVASFDDLLLGDILVYSGHVEIYVGEGENNCPCVYNCGSNLAIKTGSLLSHGTHSIDELIGVLRVR